MAAKRRDPTKKDAVPELPTPPNRRRKSWGRLKLEYMTPEQRAKFIRPEDEESYSS